MKIESKKRLSFNKKKVNLQFLKHAVSAILIAIFSHSVLAETQTYGYWKLNSLPGVTSANGTEEQQNSPADNPDVYCSIQGNGYSLPRAEQVHIKYKGKQPFTGFTTETNPGPFRRVGSLLSEWGAPLYRYNGAGFAYQGYFWIAEPNDKFTRGNITFTDESGGVIKVTYPTFLHYVACVRSII
ncbi:hypothetical protein [Thorsellia anophelis]|uniref:Uncharacterized protein n=1 Tax=Thorsellia anophelis DSM 18579 TaxID=1123402 RepID=A0A1I0FDM2_9GAMM|nr:hypothetical protein [Thorsellia anophelis]SET56047.1 hypothetical protein SAMN02583745_02727 [Thorsellia anophelis DSM 18579]